MKRLVIVLFLLIPVLVFSQTITVNSPSSGQIFKTGDVVTISWTTSGVSGNVKITLRTADDSTGYTITSSHPYNNSPYHYTVPATVAPGTYFVKIKDSVSTMGRSGLITIIGNLDLMEGSFNIGNISYIASASNTINAINILVNYDAQKDFILCKSIPEKCDPEHGSMLVTYRIKNWEWNGGDLDISNVVPAYLNSCKYACYKGCNSMTYPTGPQKRGQGSFIVTLFPSSNNALKGVRYQECGLGGWAASDHLFYYNHFPELTVTLTLCISYFDSPIMYQHKLVTDTFVKKIFLKESDLLLIGDTSCGW
jgi:hypothetical protein